MNTEPLTRPATNATQYVLTVTSKYGTFTETFYNLADARIRSLAIYNSPRNGISSVIHDEHGNSYTKHTNGW